MSELRTPGGLERTLDTPGNVTVNFSFTTTHITVLSRAQVAQQASLAFKPYTCGDTQVDMAQQAYPNQGPSNAQVALPQSAYQPMHTDRHDLYHKPVSYEARWPTSVGGVGYDASVSNASVHGYSGAAASVSAAQQAARVQGYADSAAAAHQEMSARYAAQQ